MDIILSISCLIIGIMGIALLPLFGGWRKIWAGNVWADHYDPVQRTWSTRSALNHAQARTFHLGPFFGIAALLGLPGALYWAADSRLVRHPGVGTRFSSALSAGAGC